MTQHAQKPESAEFRTREAQIDGQIEDIFEAHEAEDAERTISKGDLRLMIEAAHKQAEARGAAERRRKDAEGQDAVRQYQTPDWRWEDAVNDKTWEMAIAADVKRRVLYTRPANVPALEARVKELEGALVKVSEADNLGAKPDYHRCPIDQMAFELAWMCEEAELSANDLVIVNQEKLKTIARRVLARAAIREGGEHG